MVASWDGHFDCDRCGEGSKGSDVLTEVQHSAAHNSPATGKEDTREGGGLIGLPRTSGSLWKSNNIWNRGAAYSWLGLEKVYLKELWREKWRKEASQQGPWNDKSSKVRHFLILAVYQKRPLTRQYSRSWINMWQETKLFLLLAS